MKRVCQCVLFLQLLERRQSAGKGVLTAKDQKFLAEAHQYLMSDEESDMDGKNTWLIRSPTWRSKRLNEILLLCDTELEKKQGKNKKRNRRVRSNEPCTRSPPDVGKEYLKTDEEHQQEAEQGQEQDTEVEQVQQETAGTDKNLGGIEKEREEEIPVRRTVKVKLLLQIVKMEIVKMKIVKMNLVVQKVVVQKVVVQRSVWKVRSVEARGRGEGEGSQVGMVVKKKRGQ